MTTNSETIMSSSKGCLELKVIVIYLEKPFMSKTINKKGVW